jgi:hypothetical protein
MISYRSMRGGEQSGTGGLLLQLPTVMAQALEPGGGGVFFSVRWWCANKAPMAWALK